MQVTAELPKPTFTLLQAGTPAALITVGPDGWGHAVMTWVLALSPDRVRFAVDLGTATLANIEREGKATLQVIGKGNVLVLIKGRAQQIRERIAAAPFGMAMWELQVREVKDQSWPEAVVTPVTYRWTGPRAGEFARIEQAVLAELREWGEAPAR